MSAVKDSVYPIDSYGLPGCQQRDGSISGGDSAAILGTILFLGGSDLIEKFYDKLPLLIKDGIPVRHPTYPTNTFSRDQMEGLICVGIRDANNFTVDRLLEAHKKRWFLFAWNKVDNDGNKRLFPDLTGPKIWALWLRYKRPWWARALLATFDFEHFFGTLIWLFNVKFKKGDRITRNHMQVAIAGKRYISTWVSRLSYNWTPFKPMIDRWHDHCISVEEYQTADLFKRQLLKEYDLCTGGKSHKWSYRGSVYGKYRQCEICHAFQAEDKR